MIENIFLMIPWGNIAGGAVIGIASIAMLLVFGRIAGISGILSGILSGPRYDTLWRGVFIAGIVSSGVIASLFGLIDEVNDSQTSLLLLLVAGFLVGFGARLGSGCTSGHGICGISRLSARSIVATLVFIFSGMVTVALVSIVL